MNLTVGAVARQMKHLSFATCAGFPFRCASLLFCVAAGYSVPLVGLVRGMRYDTPLAYLGLVPFFAFAIGCWQYRQFALGQRAVSTTDIIAGAVLLALAAGICFGLPILLHPVAWSTRPDLFSLWTYAGSNRLDLLSLPIYAAGLMTLLYGRRALLWAWPALAYGFLVWPTPYNFALGHLLPWLSDTTAQTIAILSRHLPLGAIVSPTDRTVFILSTMHGQQEVSIGSACSGFNSIVAWLIVGIAVSILARGRAGSSTRSGTGLHILLWLITGCILVLIANTVRILILFILAHFTGTDIAFNFVHLTLGTLLFALLVIGMVGALPRFGLRINPPRERTNDAPPTTPTNRHIPLEVALIMLVTLSLVAAFFLGVGILRLILVLSVIYSAILFALSVQYLASRKASHVAHASKMRAYCLATIIASVLCTILMVAILSPAIRHLQYIRAEQVPALGWRINLVQQEIETHALRLIVLAPLLVAIAMLLRFIVGRMKEQATIRRSSRVTSLPPWQSYVVMAGLVVGSASGIGLTSSTVGSFNETAVAVPALIVQDFDAAPPNLPGTTRTFVQEYDWTKQVLGNSATYRRFRYDEIDAQPLWIDVMTTADADALVYHSMENCYDFHGYSIEGDYPVDIGYGASARIINFLKPDVNEAWSALYWEQRIMRGDTPFFQRIVLLYNLDVSSGNAITAPLFASSADYLRNRAEQVREEGMLETPGTG